MLKQNYKKNNNNNDTRLLTTNVIKTYTFFTAPFDHQSWKF